MGERNVKSKKLHDLSFDDLYMREDDELYPGIGQALGRLKTRIMNRRHSVKSLSELKKDSFNLPVQGIHASHLRRTGI